MGGDRMCSLMRLVCHRGVDLDVSYPPCKVRLGYILTVNSGHEPFLAGAGWFDGYSRDCLVPARC